MASFFRRAYELSDAAVEEGTWVILREEDEQKIEVRVRSERSKKGRAARQDWLTKNLKKIQATSFVKTVEQQDEDNILACVALLVEWKGVTGADDKPLPCTPENVRKICTEFSWFRDDVLQAAGLNETYRKEALDGIAKNSKQSSAVA